MTEKEKAKAYDEVLKKASAAHKDEDRHLKATLERIFPELKESDDENIRTWIIDDIRYNINNEPLNNSEYKKKAEKAIAWLEKQGEEYKVSSDKPEWIPSTEHPQVDDEVIALVGENKMISFAHIVDRNKAIDYDGWNIPDVRCWIPCPKIEED